LIRNLLCNSSKRIGFEDIKKHKFFEGINWENIQYQKAPFSRKLIYKIS
jgi:hypothetical protein